MREWSKLDLEEKIAKPGPGFVYLYTPMCGTCKVAKKMLFVVNELITDLDIGMCDLNYLPEKAREWSIESVPCLVRFEDGHVKNKIYAFQSVEFLYNEMKGH